jgi:hypothetical protein
VGDDRIDETVAAAVGDVALGEAEAQQVARVVAQRQVALRIGARRGARVVVVVVLDDDRELGGDERLRADALAGEAGVLGDGEVGVGAARALGGEVEHPRPERGGHPALARDGLRCGVEAVEERAHRGQRGAVLGGRLAVADSDAEQEASREVALELRVLVGDVGRLVLPDVEDGGRHGQRAGALEEGAHLRERRAPAHPQRAEPERLDLRGAVDAVLMAAPDPDLSQWRHRHQRSSMSSFSATADDPSARS